MSESGKSSKRSQRRRLNRDLSRAYPAPVPQPGAPGNLYPLPRPQAAAGQPGLGSGSAGLVPSGRTTPPTPPPDPRRAGRAARPNGRRGFSLRNLLSNDSAQGRSRREAPVRLPAPGGRAPDASTALAPGRPVPAANALVRSQAATVTPLVPQSSRSLRSVPAPAESPRRARSRTRPQKPTSPLLYLTRLLILGVGVGAIAGTILHVWNPKDRTATADSSSPTPAAEVQAASVMTLGRDATPTPLSQPIRLQVGQPITTLSNTLQSLINQYQGLQVSVFIVDQDNGNLVDLRGASSLPAASTIKVPILVAFLQDVETGKIRLDETLTIQQGDIAEGSGEFQYLPPGEQISALETATKMITISDNTATNMIIRRLGGPEQLNQRFRAWGLSNTAIRNPLADLSGSNTTSARDLTTLLSSVAQGELLSLRSRDRLMHIMQGTVNDSLIPAGIGDDPQAVVAHKTGNISTLTGDTAIVDMSTGKRYVITVLVQRPAGDERSLELIRQISTATYQYFQQPQAASPTEDPTGNSSGAITPADPATDPSAPSDSAIPSDPASPSEASDPSDPSSPVESTPAASPTTPEAR